MIPSLFQGAQRVASAAPDLARLHKATTAFETEFVKQLVSEMRKASESEFGDVPGSGIYDDMANQVLADKLTSTGGFGIGNAMYSQLSKLVLAQSESADTSKPS